MQSILKYIINLVICLTPTVIVNGQQATQKTEKEKIPFLSSIGVELDLSPAVTTFINNDGTYTFEGAVNAELLKKYFAVFELGYAGADKISNNDIHFNTNGVFGRLGFDFNLLKPKPNSKSAIRSYLTGGVRIGMASAPYSITNITINDDYWGSVPVDPIYETATNFWFEAVAGIRVEIFKNIFMGWSIRNRNLFKDLETGSPYPWYIPGFGITSSTSNWGFNYALGYRF